MREKEKAYKEKTPCRLHHIRGFTKKVRNPFPSAVGTPQFGFCRD